MFEYFYHEILRKTVIGFGTLFNDVNIKHFDSNGNATSTVKVPLAYGPTQKFLARLEQTPDLNRPTQISLPRMSFELVGLSYDNTRKTGTTQTFLTSSPTSKTQIKKAYLPVPYNMEFELSIMTKLNDDMLQIVEQILPYFQPQYTLTINLINDIVEKRDIPIVLNNISMQDDYESDYSTRRTLIYTLRFTAKTYLFGPVSTSATEDIIKKVSISLTSGETTATPNREVTYTVEPRALKNYTGTVTTTTSVDIGIDTNDIPVADASDIPLNSYITIGNESMYVKSKSSNTLIVNRAQDGTQIASHLLGSDVKKITAADNLLIEDGDDFGFSGSIG
jgi:hypothetical protein